MGKGEIKMLKNKWLKLDIQHFAEGGEGGQEGSEGKNDEGHNTAPTEEEIQKRIESEADRKLASALEKNDKEREAKQQEAMQKALEEQERLSKLSEKEHKDEELTKREKELADRLAEIERKELKADAVSDLNEKGLPADFADFLLAEDAEKTLENINNFKTTFDNAVNNAVKEKLRQETPSAGGGTISKNQATSVAELAQKHRLIK